MIEIHKGDIFKAPVDIIIQQCNCFCTMGKGFAKEIKKRYPRAVQVDKMTKRGDRKKLSQFTVAQADKKQDKTIINLYSQYDFRKDKNDHKLYTNYGALSLGLENIKEWIEKMGLENQVIGIPYGLGCGYGGGDWAIVESNIKKVFEKSKIKVLICINNK
jgi:O-acetyl-ADP-ribose deacetylase (regulator of RNase III)